MSADELLLCRSCHAWHPVEMKQQEKQRAEVSPGTHNGHLDDDARARRATKNARNRHNREARK